MSEFTEEQQKIIDELKTFAEEHNIVGYMLCFKTLDGRGLTMSGGSKVTGCALSLQNFINRSFDRVLQNECEHAWFEAVKDNGDSAQHCVKCKKVRFAD